MFETALRLYRYINENDGIVDEEVKKLSEILKTRSQLSKGVEFIVVSKIIRGDSRGLIILRGDKEEVLREANLLVTLVRSSFRSIDIEPVANDAISRIIGGIRNFL
ncbi:MAG: hypothetical protein QXE77_05390 [Desulfurococcaceae archaeon]